jgi:hypothetical protein
VTILLILINRAIISASVRVAQTVGYVTSSDVAYQSSPLVLAATAETTCGFIVIGLPYVPRLFSGKNLFTRMAASVRSWITMGTRRAGDSEQRGASQEQSENQNSAGSRRYRKMDEADSLPLSTMTPTNASLDERAEHSPAPDAKGRGIRMTTDIEVETGVHAPEMKPSHQDLPWDRA